MALSELFKKVQQEEQEKAARANQQPTQPCHSHNALFDYRIALQHSRREPLFLRESPKKTPLVNNRLVYHLCDRAAHNG